MTLKLVVDNGSCDSPRHRVLQNLMEADGKAVSIASALRFVTDVLAAAIALDELTAAGIIERSEIHLPHPDKHYGDKTQVFVLYRYRSERAVFRNPDLKRVV